MADVITRLRLESGEFDNKIKRATQGLLRMEEECRRAGGTLSVLEKDQNDYVSSLGRMETVSKSARGKLSELTRAYEELAVQYRRLSDEEKNGDFGKALSASLGQLKERIGEAKGQLEEVGQEMKGTSEQSGELGGAVEMLASKFGVSVEALTGWGVALAAATGALKVATDAFKQNEELMDWWGTTMEEATSLYDGFLNALNTGDMSGFLDSINQIVDAAAEAYNAMDALGTFNAFNQINASTQRAALSGAIADYREGKGSAADVKAASDTYRSFLENRQQLERENYEAKVAEYAKSRNVDPELLLNTLLGTYGNYKRIKDIPLTGRKKVVDYGGLARDHSMSGEDVIAKHTTEVAVAANDIEKLAEMLRGFTDDELKELQALGATAVRTTEEINNMRRSTARILGKSSFGGGAGGESWSMLDSSSASLGLTFGEMPVKSGRELFAEAYNFDFSKSLERVNKDRQEPNETEVKMTDLLDGISGGIGNMVGGLEQLGIDVPEGLKSAIGAIQGVSSILTGISSILTVIEAVNTADTIIPFAGGGVVKAATGFSVPGNFRSGDRVPALLNSGEVVLNRAQQGNLLSQMGGMGMAGNYEAQPYVDGEKIWLGVSNYLRRSGRGEIVVGRR